MKKKLLLLLCACMMLGGCSDAGTGKPSETEKPSVQETQGSQETPVLGEGEEQEIQQVELTDTYQKAAYFADQIYKEKHGNVLVSPLSLNVALGMATEGASGETAKELYRYLGREDYADWVDEYMTYAESLKTGSGKKSGYTFNYKLANSIWVKKEAKLLKDYQKLVEKKFRAEAENVDFVGDADRTAQKINSWCDKHTEGLIKKIVTPDKFDADLMAILVNSVYFESPWVQEWHLNNHEFTDLQGNKKEQEMLSDTLGTYYENDYATAFSKNYYNGFQFIGILPKAEGDFELGDLDLKNLLESETNEYDVRALMPQLNYETESENVIDVLKAQGVYRAFDEERAEFYRMIEDEPLYISKIIQKCKIELDKDGTRAAAVTAIFMTKESAAIRPKEKEVKEVYLDRPFAFLIYDSQKDQIVFAGKVVE
ncbi:MAG: serpin family protein [Acetatifactor sp.]|nr:serpin family protein [Acetatifactor sp.]